MGNFTSMTSQPTLYLQCLWGSLLKCDSCHGSNWWHPYNSLNTGLTHSVKCNVLQNAVTLYLKVSLL